MTTDPETPTARAEFPEWAATCGWSDSGMEGHCGRDSDDLVHVGRWDAHGYQPVPYDSVYGGPGASSLRRADEARVAEGLTVEMLAKAAEAVAIYDRDRTIAGDYEPKSYTEHAMMLLDALPAPRPPEPDRTAALVEALEDARKTIVVQHGGHYGCADGDCYVRDTLDRIAPLLAPEPATVADERCYAHGGNRELPSGRYCHDTDADGYCDPECAECSLPAPRPPEPDRTAALVAAIRMYAAHLAECSCRPHLTGYLNRPCDCGLRTMLEETERLATPEPPPVADGTVGGDWDACGACGRQRMQWLHMPENRGKRWEMQDGSVGEGHIWEPVPTPPTDGAA